MAKVLTGLEIGGVLQLMATQLHTIQVLTSRGRSHYVVPNNLREISLYDALVDSWVLECAPSCRSESRSAIACAPPVPALPVALAPPAPAPVYVTGQGKPVATCVAIYPCVSPEYDPDPRDYESDESEFLDCSVNDDYVSQVFHDGLEAKCAKVFSSLVSLTSQPHSVATSARLSQMSSEFGLVLPGLGGTLPVLPLRWDEMVLVLPQPSASPLRSISIDTELREIDKKVFDSQALFRQFYVLPAKPSVREARVVTDVYFLGLRLQGEKLLRDRHRLEIDQVLPVHAFAGFADGRKMFDAILIAELACFRAHFDNCQEFVEELISPLFS